MGALKLINVRNCLITLAWCIIAQSVKAQNVVKVDDNVPQHIFSYGEIESLPDPGNTISFADVLKPEVAARFKKSTTFTPKYYNSKSYFWYKFKIKNSSQTKKHWLLEFFDQTINDITLYVPLADNTYKTYKYGYKYNFEQREYKHKNFTLDLDNKSDTVSTYYVKIRATQAANVLIVLRDIHWYIEYALSEYLIFGLFFGMILIFSLYNLLMFIAIRQSRYLYYVLYNLSIGFYEMCQDGIAFQYLWPNTPVLNQYSVGTAIFLSSIFGMLFTLNFLYLKTKAPRLYNWMLALITLRCLFYIACLFDQRLFTYKVIEFIPMLFAFGSGVYVLRRGFKAARFFVAGYLFLLIGFSIKILLFLDVLWIPYGVLTHYSLSFCFVIEMVLVSFAIGDSIRHLRKKKDNVQKRMIQQLQINHDLKDTLNNELSNLVEQRTKELVENAIVIKQQNDELQSMNLLLKEQAESISNLNGLLELDNHELQVNIEKVTRARVMSQDVDFEEFSKIYPDRESCFKYLSELKWEHSYTCRKCGNNNYLSGHLPYSRRCTKCRYEESVIAYTIFQNTKIPITKSFYMLFLIYTSKGSITSNKLSEILEIRQSTCWSYRDKIKKIMDERKKELKNVGAEGWSKLVLEHTDKDN
ncbi:chromosome partitioning protein ParA [Mucilaginibacter sp. HMF5004]|uniref:7TM diverse intracellular signaling domain-containing protein n=1 Tax=Mucilaginibacter rivuli TaxID=2857527 RepID=UPI001C5EEFA2|nr:7TM diverse intracellular signaling domain-containing protein [Mucilaginibacter rivuli]MBW4888569.1 chromosome partitioning protein ParA [Mucilaginibacter rivuli]